MRWLLFRASPSALAFAKLFLKKQGLCSRCVAPALRSAGQQPLQILLIFLSTFKSCASSALIASSPGSAGPEVTVPSMRPAAAPPAGLPAVPTVVDPLGAAPPVDDADPDELAVPAELVPGVFADFAEFPEPLGSFAELLRPPALAGPLGTPLDSSCACPSRTSTRRTRG